VTKGKYQGLDKVSFSHGNIGKTCKLSLINYSLRESGTGKNDMDIISDPHDHLCTVHLLKYHIQFNLPPNWKGFLFLCKASTEIIKLRKSLGITYCVDIYPISSTDSTPHGKFGRTFLSKQVRQLAIMCKFNIAEKFTGQSARRGSISKMASSGVASGEILGHARHKSVHIITVYQSCNTATSDHRNSCFLIGTSSTDQNSTSTYTTNNIQQVPPTAPFPWYCSIQSVLISNGSVPCSGYIPQPICSY
jgi:hypothetical protein